MYVHPMCNANSHQAQSIIAITVAVHRFIVLCLYIAHEVMDFCLHNRNCFILFCSVIALYLLQYLHIDLFKLLTLQWMIMPHTVSTQYKHIKTNELQVKGRFGCDSAWTKTKRIQPILYCTIYYFQAILYENDDKKLYLQVFNVIQQKVVNIRL